MKTILATVLTKKLNYFEVMLPAKRIVCPHCEGEGTELCGGLKGEAFSSEEMADDDFRESYFGGDYDVACSQCHGKRVLDVVDEEKLSPKMRDRFERNEAQNHRDEMDSYYERRAGA